MGAKDIDGKTIDAEMRVIRVCVTKECGPWRHEQWLAAAAWEIFIFKQWEEKDKP